MSYWGFWALFLALLLPAGNALALQCDAPRPAPMACCENGMAECAEPGMLATCCLMGSGSDSGRAFTACTPLQKDPSLSAGKTRAVGMTWLTTSDPALSRFAAPVRALPRYVPPFSARTTVLRI